MNTTNTNNYRIDVVPISLSGEYKVPVGMNTIVYLSHFPPNVNFTAAYDRTKSVLLYSKWNDRECTFKVVGTWGKGIRK